jgi:CubicO group peptidase (beta-lactamase class C family)
MSELDCLAEDHGFDSERLHQLETWAGNLISSKKLPGVILAVARKGSIVFHEAIGSNGYQKDSIMEVGSMATPLVFAAFLSLVDEGFANIDDPVTKYLPYFDKFRVHVSGRSPSNFKTEPLTSVMTMRHLLTGTWGFPGTFYVQSKNADIRALDAMASAIHPCIGKDSDFEKLVEVPLISQPGNCYRDSIAPTVVAHIICKITGKPIQEVMHERILSPLNMIDTDWRVPPEKQQRVARQFSAAPWLTNRL